MSSSERFGYEWDKYSSLSEYKKNYRDQFLNWTFPLREEFYKGKKVLDAGCGMGRNAYWPLLWRASSLTAFEKDERSVTRAKENLKEFAHAKTEIRDIYDLPWRDEFDFAFSIGVIHHLKDPKRALTEIKKALRPGGEVLLWVYGSAGFEGILRILNPVRRYFTSKLPLPLLHALTYCVSIPFYYIFLKIFRPKKAYFRELSQFSFSHVHSIIFDQLLPDVANYYTEAEARNLLSEFEGVTVTVPPNKNGWIVRGKKA